jgi:hypothetical protein
VLHSFSQRVLGRELPQPVDLANLRQETRFSQAVKLADHPLLVPKKALMHRTVEHPLEGVHSRFWKLKM